MKKGEKRAGQEIRAVIFDMNGVLEIGSHHQKIYSVKPVRGHKALGLHEDIAQSLKIDLDKWFDAIDTGYTESIEGKYNLSQILSIISKNLNISKKKLEKILIKIHRRHFQPNKQLYHFAFNLRKKGYKIAILSDQWPVSKKALIDKKLVSKFNSIVLSCDVGVRKPNPKIYKIALQKLHISAKQALFIDNRGWNLISARKLGMSVILFKNTKQAIKQIEGMLK